jgi:hypothetical protein
VADGFSFQLPVELLRVIFEEYLRLDLPVQILLEVNRRWRTVVLETQSLWRRLLLSADAIPDSLSAGSVHACASEIQATRILNRSGAITNLEITFVLGPKEAATPTPERRASLFKTVGHTALHRISVLCIIINPRMTLPLVSASLDDVFRGSLPSLEFLKIGSTQAIGNLYEPLTALMDIIEESSTKLKSLYLENVNKDFILQASTKFFWTRLVNITIQNEFGSLDASLFSFSPYLELFSFSGELVATPAPFAAHLYSALVTLMEFPELKQLRVGLISMGTLARLHLPKLHTATIDGVARDYGAPAPPPGTLHLPALKVLQIATVDPTIACINAPTLDKLYLSIRALRQADANGMLEAVFHGGEGMMSPKHLTLRGPVEDMYLVSALRFLGKELVSLELDSQMPLGRAFWAAMTPSESTQHGFRASAASIVASVTKGAYANTGAVSTGGRATKAEREREYKPLLLPNLRCLVVDVHKTPMAQGEGREMRILQSKLIAGRRANAQYENLLRLACKWREGPGVEEIVDPPMCPRCTDASSKPFIACTNPTITDPPVADSRLRVSSVPPANAKEVRRGSIQPAAGTTCDLDAHKDALSQKSPAEIPENMCAQIHVIPIIDCDVHALNRCHSWHTRIS